MTVEGLEIPFSEEHNTHAREGVPPHLPCPSPSECSGGVRSRGTAAQTYVGEDRWAAVLDPVPGALVAAPALVPAPAAAHEALGLQAALACGEVATARASDVQEPHLGMESGGEGDTWSSMPTLCPSDPPLTLVPVVKNSEWLCSPMAPRTGPGSPREKLDKVRR